MVATAVQKYLRSSSELLTPLKQVRSNPIRHLVRLPLDVGSAMLTSPTLTSTLTENEFNRDDFIDLAPCDSVSQTFLRSFCIIILFVLHHVYNLRFREQIPVYVDWAHRVTSLITPL